MYVYVRTFLYIYIYIYIMCVCVCWYVSVTVCPLVCLSVDSPWACIQRFTKLSA